MEVNRRRRSDGQTEQGARLVEDNAAAADEEGEETPQQPIEQEEQSEELEIEIP